MMSLRRHRRSLQGYVLIPVAVALAVIGVLAFYTANQSAFNVNRVASEIETTRAEYVAQAGLQHALRHHANQGCGPFTDLTDISLGNDLYTTSLTTDLGSTTSYNVEVDQDTWINSKKPDETNAGDATLQIKFKNGDIERPLLRYDLSAIPAGANVISATAFFYLNKETPEGPLGLHELTSDWQDTTATWNTMSDQFAETTVATIPRQPRKDIWIEVNLTSLVQSWVNGQPNNGIGFTTTFEGVNGDYFGIDTGPRKPYMTVVTGASPSPDAQLKAIGTLSGGSSRTLSRDIVLRQATPSFYEIQPDADEGFDTWLNENQPTQNYATNERLRAEERGNDDTSVIRFNLGRIPRGAAIENATLTLYQYDNAEPAGDVGVYRLTRAFEEDEATWNRSENGENWSNAGGDSDQSAIDTVSIPANTTGFFDWDITELMQGWVSGTYPNHGLILRATSSDHQKDFYSSDHTVAAERPRLAVTYRCDCGTNCLPQQGSGGRIAMVGNWTGFFPVFFPDPRDVEKAELFESWGYEVDQHDDNYAGDINFSNYDVVYVSETSTSGSIGNDLNNITIGVVNEEPNLLDELGIGTAEIEKVGSIVDIVDNDHFITRPFATGPVPIYDGEMEVISINGAASGLQSLADFDGNPGLATLDVGAAMAGGGSAAGRRVNLPVGQYGNANFNWDQINSDGLLMVQRSIEWAMGNDIVSIGEVLLVVGNPGSLTAQEAERRTLIESWGYGVNLIDESDSQADFNAALTENQVVYVPEDVVASNLGSKLVGAPIGVVLEEANLVDEFGFAESIVWGSGTDVKTQRFDYITTTLTSASSTILTTPESLAALSGARAPDLQVIGETAAGVSLAKLNTGARLFGGGTAAGRRVLLPWGGNDMEINHLNDDGRTIMQRSIEWAAGANLPGPVAHWQLDETSGTTAVDSEGGNDGTLVNDPDWTTAGLLDGGLEFDGVDDYFDITGSTALDDVFVGGATVTAWIYARSWGENNYARILDKSSQLGGDRDGWMIGLFGDNQAISLAQGFSGGRGFWRPQNGTFPLGEWVHVAISYNASSDVNNPVIYQNGIRQTNLVEIAPSGTIRSDAGITLRMGNHAQDSSRTFDGILDDVRIFDRILGPAEIDELARLPGPVAHWPLDETSGNNAEDIAADNDGSLVSIPQWTPALVDGGLQFDGSDDYVNAGSFDVTGSGITMLGWFNADTIGTNDPRFISKASGTAVQDAYWQLSTRNSGSNRYLRMRIKAGGTTSELGDSNNELVPGEWYLATATYDALSGEMKLYLNGSEIASGSHAGKPFSTLIDVLHHDLRDHVIVANARQDLLSPAIATTGGEGLQQFGI